MDKIQQAVKILEDAGWIDEKGRFWHTYGQLLDAHNEVNHCPLDTLRLLQKIQDSLTEEGKHLENIQAYGEFLNVWNPVKN